MSLATAAIMKTIHDVVLSHPLIILVLSVFILSTVLSVLLLAFFVDGPSHLPSSPTDEEAREYPWWNSDVPGYLPVAKYSPVPGCSPTPGHPLVPGSADSRSARALWTNSDVPRYSHLPGLVDLRLAREPWTNSPLEISRRESELLAAVNREYMKDDAKRLATFEWGSREE